jgi:hypothetical protein
MKKLLCVILVCAIASIANAADIRYMGNGAWETTANWQGGVMPGAADSARMNWGNNTVTVSSTVPTVAMIQAGVDESGTLHVLSGGVATTLAWAGAGVAGACTGTFNVDAGGIMNLGGHLWVGAGGVGNVGVVNVSGTINVGGIIGIGTIDAVNPSGGTGTVSVLSGGVLNLGNIHSLGTSIQPGSVLDIIGTGLVTLPGDFVGVIGNYVAAGQITGNGIVGNVSAVFDGSQTLVTVPEPITVALLSLGALLLRKRS